MSRIYKRGSYYYVDVMRKGRRVRKRIGKSKKLAETVLKEMEVQIERNQWGFGKTEGDIKAVIDAFLLNAELHVRSSTRCRYTGIIKKFSEFLKERYPKLKKVSDLSPNLIQEYKLHRAGSRILSRKHTSIGKIEKNGKLHPKTMNLELKTLKSVFKFGVQNGLCGSNPFAEVKLLKVDRRKVPKYLTADECQRFLRCCPDEFKPVFVTLINTGMRLGEMLNLQWEDIDFDNGLIKIRTKEFWVPKSGERVIPLNRTLANEFMRLKGKSQESDLVFRRSNDDNYGRRLRKLAGIVAKKAGIISHVNIHTFRHSFASQLVMSGVDLPTVQTLLGHSDIQTTMIYSHLASSHLKSAVEVMDALYSTGSSVNERVTSIARAEEIEDSEINSVAG